MLTNSQDRFNWVVDSARHVTTAIRLPSPEETTYTGIRAPAHKRDKTPRGSHRG